MKKTLKSMCFMLKYAWSLDKLYLLFRIPIALISSLRPFILIIYPAKIIEEITCRSEVGIINRYIIEMTLLQLLTGFLSYLFNKLLTIRYNAFEYKHSLAMGRKVMNVSFPITEDAEVLNLIERIKPIGYIEKSFESLFSFASRFITIVGLVWVLAKVNIFVMFTIVIVLAINIVLNRKLKLYDYQWKKEAAPYRRRNDYLLRLMYGFQYGKEIRVNQMESYLTNKYDEHSAEYLTKMKKVGDRYFLINNLTSLAAGAQLLVVYISLSGSALTGAITIAEFTKFLNAINSLSSSLVKFSNGFVDIRNNFKYVEDLMEFFSLEEEKSTPEKKILNKGEIEIEFCNVSFKYPNTNHCALENVNIKIPPKSKVTIVGLNGSGKTTFTKLLLGLYKPTSGHIYINGVDINEFDSKEYLKRFACAFQDVRMFAYPIRENIVLAQDYDEKKLEKIIDQCGLRSVIEKLPLKINTPIFKFLDKAGVEFSGGETQKIEIARAVYKDSEVVILDEPLASLDPVSEYNLYYSLNKIVHDRTCIFVSHRLSLARGCDKILVFDNGHLLESGTHDELMHIKDGKYADMYKKQSSFYVTEKSANNE